MSSRLTVDIPEELHKKMKIEATIMDTNIKSLVVYAMNYYFSKKPNDETLKTFAKTDKGEELKSFDSQEDFMSYLKNILQPKDLRRILKKCSVVAKMNLNSFLYWNFC